MRPWSPAPRALPVLLLQPLSLGGAGEFRPWRSEKPHRLDDAVLRLQYFHRPVSDLPRYARYRNVLQVLEDQAVQGLGAIKWQRQAQLAVEFPQRRGALDQSAPILCPPERRGARRCRRGELADDLLDDVLQRHQPLEFAVLVHHQRDALVVFLEVLQLCEPRR